jgi:2-octaprenyl-6-methoxyphenol hydroxylase
MSILSADTIVSGAGPAGMIAALELAHAGRSVVLAGPPSSRDDKRTTALMIPSLDRLDAFGIGEELRAAGAPLKVMRIVDATRRLIRSAPVSFHAAEVGRDAFGWNFPNLALNAALEGAVAREPRISRIVSLVDAWDLQADHVQATLGTDMVTAKLAVAADGRRSPARDAAGIKVTWREWPQSALVLTFSHERHHGFVSTEFHTEHGPCVQVPLPGNRSSLVWVLAPAQAQALHALSDEELARKVEERLESILGKVRLEGGRQVWPLANAVPERFAARRVALVGETAHVFPPIGAQGLNLSIRDAVDLTTAVDGKADPGAPDVLERYEQLRRPDVHARLTAVSMLNRSLLSDLLPVQALRAAGLGLLARVPPLRALFMREGMKPGDGIRALPGALREKVRG